MEGAWRRRKRGIRLTHKSKIMHFFHVLICGGWKQANEYPSTARVWSHENVGRFVACCKQRLGFRLDCGQDESTTLVKGWRWGHSNAAMRRGGETWKSKKQRSYFQNETPFFSYQSYNVQWWKSDLTINLNKLIICIIKAFILYIRETFYGHPAFWKLTLQLH